jgi:hypothetical protein
MWRMPSTTTPPAAIAADQSAAFCFGVRLLTTRRAAPRVRTFRARDLACVPFGAQRLIALRRFDVLELRLEVAARLADLMPDRCVDGVLHFQQVPPR